MTKLTVIVLSICALAAGKAIYDGYAFRRRTTLPRSSLEEIERDLGEEDLDDLELTEDDL